MSKIDEQIKDLKLRKRKIEFLYAIEMFIANNKDFKDVSTEIHEVMQEFITNQIESIENSSEMPQKVEFEKEEISILKDMVKRLAEKKSEVKVPNSLNPEPKTPRPTPPKGQKPQVDRQDKLSFALANRHLDQKKVQVITENGNVSGTVCGIDAPFIVVKTETGYTIQVPLDKIII